MPVSTVKLNGTTLMTVNDTTATQGDVINKYFYAADGTKTLGTASGGITPTGNINITEAGVTDVTNYATATVPSASFWTGITSEYYNSGNTRMWKATAFTEIDSSQGDNAGYITEGHWDGEEPLIHSVVPSGTTVTPTESSQSIGGRNYMMEGAVTVNAISSTYVGSGITRRSSSDLTASGATVTVPSGYYSAQASKSVSAGSTGTPTATKGTVSNHAVSVTPSVTNTTGYITGGTINGTAVSVSASELVSGSDTVTTNDTYDVTNLAELVVNVPSSTPTIQSLSVAPSTTQQTFNASGVDGYKPVTVSAVSQTNLSAGNIKSGTTITISNGTSNLWSVTGTYSGGSLTVATKTLTNTTVAQSLSFTSLSGQPKYWFLRVTSQVSSSGSTTYYYVTDLFYDGTNIKGNSFRIGSTRRIYNITSGISQSYSSGTLTITAGSSTGAAPGQFYGASNIGYELVYIY